MHAFQTGVQLSAPPEKDKSDPEKDKSDPEIVKLKIFSFLFLITPVTAWLNGWKYYYIWYWTYIAILIAVACYAVTQKIREEKKAKEEEDEEKKENY